MCNQSNDDKGREKFLVRVSSPAAPFGEIAAVKPFSSQHVMNFTHLSERQEMHE